MSLLGVNWSGLLATLSALRRPSIISPRLVVPDITRLDWAAFKENGVTGVVIDKDNCVTKPDVDTLVPSLQPAWSALLATFGPSNVLVVSNSAGTVKDSLLLQAESVSRNLRVPVLVHATPKPGRRCAESVARYFRPVPLQRPSLGQRLAFGGRREELGAVVRSSRGGPRVDGAAETLEGRGTARPTKLLVIGDRLTTDMILAHRLATLPSSSNPHTLPIETIAILTTTLHASESLPTALLRALERLALRRLPASPRTGPWDFCVLAPPSSPAVAAPIPKRRLSLRSYFPRRPSLSLASLANTAGHLSAFGTAASELWSLPPSTYPREWNWSRKWRSVFLGSGSANGSGRTEGGAPKRHTTVGSAQGFGEGVVARMEGAAETARLNLVLRRFGIRS